MLPKSIPPCCYAKELQLLFSHLDTNLRINKSDSASAQVLVEPEVTLSTLISWLVWEVPNTHIHLHLHTITAELTDTLSTLKKRKNVALAPLPTTPLVSHIEHTQCPNEETEYVTLTSDQPRRHTPIIIKVEGILEPSASTMRRLIFQITRTEQIEPLK